MTKNYIDCKNISFSYEKGNQILKNISFKLEGNESLGIIGANGVGKSTLLRILIGLELNFTGEVKINGISLSKQTLPKIRKEMGYLFQNSDNQLFTQTVYEDVAFALYNNGLDRNTVHEKVMNTLEVLNISYLKDKKNYKMSGGEKKMAAIATILAMNPQIILLDEPSIALDPKNRRKMIQTLNSLEHSKIIASHDLDLILETCNRVILMGEGSIVKEGTVDEILYNKELLEENNLELPLSLSKYK